MFIKKIKIFCWWFFFVLQNGGNSLAEKTFGYIINIYFKFSKKMEKTYDDLKDWAKMF
jgi:hypothetical protein